MVSLTKFNCFMHISLPLDIPITWQHLTGPKVSPNANYSNASWFQVQGAWRSSAECSAEGARCRALPGTWHLLLSLRLPGGQTQGKQQTAVGHGRQQTAACYVGQQHQLQI